jgi:hypothetical protein
LCPTNDCKQGLIGGTYAPSTEVPSMWGTLKIENKTTSTPQTIKYNLIPFKGDFDVTGIEEDRKSGNNVIVFNGDFGLGGVKNTDRFTSATDLKLKYNVTGTFDNATKVLTFKGQRSAS